MVLHNTYDKLDLEDSLSLVEKRCIYCGSKNIIKRGIRKNKNRMKQRYLCKDCDRRFVVDIVNSIKGDAKIVTLVLDLYYKGLSVRKIQDHLYQFYNIEIHYSTVYRYLRKYTKMINKFVNKFKIKPSKIWNADETTLYFKRGHKWVWSVLDKESRFLIAMKLTQYRFVSDKENVFTKSKEIVEGCPKIVTSDRFHGYKRMVKMNYPNTEHKGFVGFKHRLNNNSIERLHSNLKERTKIMRGFKRMNTAREILEGWRMYYNFVRPHLALNGLTPSQTVGIDLELERNKWLSLLKESIRS